MSETSDQKSAASKQKSQASADGAKPDKQLEHQLTVVDQLARDPSEDHPSEAPKAPLTEHGEKSGLKSLVDDLHERRARVKLGGGTEKIEQQHGKGKLTARERIDLLVDRGTFVELGIHARPHFSQKAMEGRDAPADGVITGFGDVDGRLDGNDRRAQGRPATRAGADEAHAVHLAS